MEKGTTNKYWQRVEEAQKISIKIDFYRMLALNINNEEQEDRKKALKFRDNHHKKHIYWNPGKFFDDIEKAILEDDEKSDKEFIEDVQIQILDDFKQEEEKVRNYFLLYEKYRQDLDQLCKDNLFIDILLKNNSIVYKDSMNLLNIGSDLVKNYFEVQAIKLIQECMLNYLEVEYKVKFPTEPFKKVITDYFKFVDRQGFTININKCLEFPREDTIKFINNNINFLGNPQNHINRVITLHSVSMGIEEKHE